jgi:hypothetical protein
MVKPSRRGPMVERLVDSYLVSERRACRVLRVPRATYRYRSCLDPRTELRMRIREIAQARVRYGYRKIVSVRPTHIDSYRLLAAHAVGVSSGSFWMDELASPGRTAVR